LRPCRLRWRFVGFGGCRGWEGRRGSRDCGEPVISIAALSSRFT